jgi:hypothetical protein
MRSWDLGNSHPYAISGSKQVGYIARDASENADIGKPDS